MTVKTVGLDLAKDVFQVHGISENGRVVFNKPIKRAKLLAFFETLPPFVVGMEACGSSHHWGRQLRTLGHDVKLMPAGYVKPYVKRGKNDAVDAEAICEAVRRPTMRFVEIKTEDQQAILSIHRTARPGRPAAHPAGQYDPQPAARVRPYSAHWDRSGDGFCEASLGWGSPGHAGDRDRHARHSVLSVHRPERAHRRILQDDRATCLAERRCAQVDAHAGDRADHDLSDCRHYRRCASVPNRKRSGRLAGPHPAQQVERRQGETGQDHQAGGSLHSKAAGCGYDIARGHGKTVARESRSLDSQDYCRQTVSAGNSRDGKQGSAFHLGDADKETRIPAASVLTAQTAHEMQDVEVMMRK